MVLPLLIGGGLLGGYVLDKAGILGEGGLLTSAVGEAVDATVAVIPVVIEKTAPAVVNGIEAGVEAVKESVEGRVSNVMKNLTIVILTYTTFRLIRSITLEK